MVPYGSNDMHMAMRLSFFCPCHAECIAKLSMLYCLQPQRISCHTLMLWTKTLLATKKLHHICVSRISTEYRASALVPSLALIPTCGFCKLITSLQQMSRYSWLVC